MKKIEILMLFFCLLGVALSAEADGIWAPFDEYIIANDNSCEIQQRPYFLASGKNGSVTAMKTPLDRTPIKTYPNGTEFKISYVCGKGNNRWAAIQAVRMSGKVVFTEVPNGINGYIPYGDLVRSYDSEEFTKDHKKQIQKFDEKKYNFCSSGPFVLWSAPNSGVQIQYITSDMISMLCEFMRTSGGQYKRYEFGGTYKDEKGNRWVEFTYNYQDHGWFCLDQMTKGGVKP